jgi:hypothetical protein
MIRILFGTNMELMEAAIIQNPFGMSMELMAVSIIPTPLGMHMGQTLQLLLTRKEIFMAILQ